MLWPALRSGRRSLLTLGRWGCVRSGVPSDGLASVGPTCTSSVTPWCGAQKRYVYLRLVQAYRDEHGRVRHRVLRTLGREDELKASGQLEQLMGPSRGSIRRWWGCAARSGRCCWPRTSSRQLDLIGTVDRALPQRGRSQLSAGEVCAALICSRLCSPSPLYDVAGWASGAALQELVGIPPALLNDDRLGRGLETLAVYAESLRGALAARAIERFGIDAGRLHVDLTTLRVAGAYEHSALVAKGWGPDRARRAPGPRAAGHQRLRRLALRAPRPGQRRRGRADRRRRWSACERSPGRPGLVVCDAACGHPKTLAQIARSGLRFIVPLQGQHGLPRALPARRRRRARCGRWATSPSASATCRRRCARATAARCATGRSPTPRPASRSRCASPTSTPPKRRARSPPPESAR